MPGRGGVLSALARFMAPLLRGAAFGLLISVPLAVACLLVPEGRTIAIGKLSIVPGASATTSDQLRIVLFVFLLGFAATPVDVFETLIADRWPKRGFRWTALLFLAHHAVSLGGLLVVGFNWIYGSALLRTLSVDQAFEAVRTMLVTGGMPSLGSLDPYLFPWGWCWRLSGLAGAMAMAATLRARQRTLWLQSVLTASCAATLPVVAALDSYWYDDFTRSHLEGHLRYGLLGLTVGLLWPWVSSCVAPGRGHRDRAEPGSTLPPP
jgi:hypothetical protein